MAYENINFSKNHLVVRDGYFYFIDEVSNVLYKKISNGSTAFTYPIVDVIGTTPIKCLMFDGHFFWALQQNTNNLDITIKKFFLKNYVLELSDTINFIHDTNHSFNINSFSVECYNTTLSGAITKGESNVKLAGFSDLVEPGTVLTIGPNNEDLYEDVTVTGTLNNGYLGLDFYIQNNYDDATSVYFSKNLLLINTFAFNRSNAGALYKIKLPQKSISEVIENLDFVNMTASCFYQDVSEGYLLGVLGVNLRFINVKTLITEKTMTLDNISVDRSTIFQIYALQVDRDTLFRLQRKATYYDYTYNYTTANFQVSTIRSFVDSISIDVYPKILPSNGVNIANVIAIAKDQYAHPLINKPIRFADDDPDGYMTIIDTYTDLTGKAISYYKAGLIPNNVNIFTTITQYD